MSERPFLVVPSLNSSAQKVRAEVEKVLDCPPDSQMARLVMVESKPGIGSSTVVNETLRQLVDLRSGWAIPGGAGSGWDRVALCRQGLPQPLPQDNRVSWLCLTFDGSRSADGGIGQLAQAMGILATAPTPSQDPDTREALGKIARGAAQLGTRTAVEFGIGLLPFGGAITTLLEIGSSVDPAHVRELIASLRSSSSDEEADGSGAIGSLIASQLIEAMGTFEEGGSAVPLLLVVDNAHLAGAEIQGFVRSLLLDADAGSRAVAVLVSRSLDSSGDWLEDLAALTAPVSPLTIDGSSIGDESSDGDGDMGSELTDSGDPDDGELGLEVMRFTVGPPVDGIDAVQLEGTSQEEAISIVQSLSPPDAVGADVAKLLVGRSSTEDGVLSVGTLLDHLSSAAKRNGERGLILDESWAMGLTSFAAEQANELVSQLFAEQDPGPAALLQSIAHLGSVVSRDLAAWLTELLDVAPSTTDHLEALGALKIGENTITLIDRVNIVAACEREFRSVSPTEQQRILGTAQAAAANWLADFAGQVEDGEQLLDPQIGRLLKDSILRGLETAAPSGRQIDPRVRHALGILRVSDPQSAQMWTREALDLLRPSMTDRNCAWLVLSYTLIANRNLAIADGVIETQAAVLGESLGYIADIAACPTEVRQHPASAEVIKAGFRSDRGHKELAERALIAVAQDDPARTMSLLGMISDERLDEIVDGLLTTSRTPDRDILVARCVERGADRSRAMLLLSRGEIEDVNSAIALAQVTSGLTDKELDESIEEVGLAEAESDNDFEIARRAAVQASRNESKSAESTRTELSDRPPSATRATAFEVLKNFIEIAEDDDTSRRARSALADIASSVGTEKLIIDAFRSIDRFGRNPRDVVLLCHLARPASLSLRSEALERAVGIGGSASAAIARARLIHGEADVSQEVLSDLVKELARHRRNPLCFAHLLRLGQFSRVEEWELQLHAAGDPFDNGSAIAELRHYLQLDMRSATPLVELVTRMPSDVAKDFAPEIIETLEKAIGGARGKLTSQHEVAGARALLLLAPHAGHRRHDVARSAMTKLDWSATTKNGPWAEDDVQSAARSIVDNADLLTVDLVKRALRTLIQDVQSPANAKSLARYQMRGSRPVQLTTNIARDVRRILIDQAENDVECAYLGLLSDDVTAEERDRCWRELRNRAVVEPSASLLLLRSATGNARSEIARRLVALHARYDIPCALEYVTWAPEISEELGDRLVRWAQIDPRVAVLVTKWLMGQDESVKEQFGDSRQQVLRDALVHHAAKDLRCASAVLRYFQPSRPVMEEVHGRVLRHPASPERAALMFRTSCTPARASASLEAVLKMTSRSSARRNVDRAMSILEGTPAWHLARYQTERFRRNSQPEELKRHLENALDVATLGASEPSTVVRMASWAVAAWVYANQFQVAATLKRPQDRERQEPPEAANTAFNVMLSLGMQADTGSAFLPVLYGLAHRRHSAYVWNALLNNVRHAPVPSDFAVRTLVSNTVERAERVRDRPNPQAAQANRRKVQRISRVFAGRRNERAVIDAAVLLLNSHFYPSGKPRRFEGVNAKALIKKCRGKEFDLSYVTEVIRLGQDEETVIGWDERTKDRILDQVVSSWTSRVDVSTILACRAQTAGMSDPQLLFIRALVLSKQGDEAALRSLREILRESLSDPLAAIALARIAETTSDVELARSALLQHAAIDYRAARECAGLASTIRRRHELTEVVKSADYRSAFKKGELLAELAWDESSRREAEEFLTPMVEQSRGALASLALVANPTLGLFTQVKEAIAPVEASPYSAAASLRERQILARALVPLFVKLNGFSGTGLDIVRWLGREERSWPPVALELLRAHEHTALLDDESREQAVRNAVNGLARNEISEDELFPLLTAEEREDARIRQLRATSDPLRKVGFAYEIDRKHDPEAVVQSLKPLWAPDRNNRRLRGHFEMSTNVDDVQQQIRADLFRDRVAEMALTASLWKLDGRDLDDEAFAEAWFALSRRALVQPHLVPRLAQHSKMPLAQRSLVDLLMSARAITDESPNALALCFSAKSESDRVTAGSAARQRRLTTASIILNLPLREVLPAQQILISESASVVELAVASLTLSSPFGKRARDLLQLLTQQPDPAGVIVPTLLQLAELHPVSGILAVKVARSQGLLGGSNKAEAREDDESSTDILATDDLAGELIEANLRWSHLDPNASTLLSIFGSVRPRFQEMFLSFVDDVLRRDDVGRRLATQLAWSVPIVESRRLLDRIDVWQSKSSPKDEAAFAEARNTIERRIERRDPNRKSRPSNQSSQPPKSRRTAQPSSRQDVQKAPLAGLPESAPRRSPAPSDLGSSTPASSADQGVTRATTNRWRPRTMIATVSAAIVAAALALAIILN